MSKCLCKKVIYIVSLKYSPGLYKEFHLIGENLEQKGSSIKHILSKGYEEMVSQETMIVDYMSTSRNIREVISDFLSFPFKGLISLISKLKSEKPRLIYFYNTHPLNIIFTWLARLYIPNILIALHLHEPFQPDKSLFATKQKVIVNLQEYLQKKMVKLTNYIVAPSPYAKELIDKHFPWFNGVVHTVPLCIPDEPAISYKREYVAMTGHVYPDGRVDDFCRLLEYAANTGCSFRFRIITSSQITAFLHKKLSEASLSLLDIVEKRPLSDMEINKHMANAFASLSMHTRGSQSGVTPVAFMNGTPIVARNIPMFNQFIRNMVNGRLVSPTAEPSEWFSAIEDVRNNLEEMSKEARKSFISTFHKNKLENYLEWVNKEINQKTDAERKLH